MDKTVPVPPHVKGDGTAVRGHLRRPPAATERRSTQEKPSVGSLSDLAGDEKDFSGRDLSGIDLSGMDLRGYIFTGANLTGANLEGAILDGVRLSEVTLLGANLRNSSLRGAVLADVDLRGVSAEDVDLTGVRVLNADMAQANFSGGTLKEVVLEKCVLTETNFYEADLQLLVIAPSTLLESTNFTRANLTGATLADLRLSWCVFDEANLKDVDLSRSASDSIYMYNTVLDGTNLSEGFFIIHSDGMRCEGEPVNATDAQLTFETVIRVTGFNKSIFGNAQLSGIDWTGEDLSGEKLKGLYELRNSVLDGANLTNAELDDVILRNCSMREAKAVGAKMQDGELFNVDAAGADFTNAQMRKLYVENSQLEEALLVNCDWSDGAIYHSDATGADFTNGNLSSLSASDASFNNSIMVGANLKNAHFVGSVYDAGSDLRGVEWKDTNTEGVVLAVTDEETYGKSDARRVCALYDSVSLPEASVKLGIDVETAGVLVWSGALEARDPETHEVVTSGFDSESVRVPSWALAG